MNKFKYICALCVLVSLFGCRDDRSVDFGTSVITDHKVDSAQFDKWLNVNYLAPYNISVQHKYEDIESNFHYHLVPSDYQKSVQLAHFVKYMCIEPYDEVTGSKDFIRHLFPKVISFIGSPGVNANGTELLGVAEGGRKIVLYKVNNLDPTNIRALNEYYFHTIHHEFTHIQNQTKPYTKDFQVISGKDYVADAWSNNATFGSPKDVRNIVRRENYTPNVRNYYLTSDSIQDIKKKSHGNPSAKDKKILERLNRRLEEYKNDDSYMSELHTYRQLNTMMYRLSTSEINALRKGFISPYSAKDDIEDFAELQSFYITDSKEDWHIKMLIAGDEGSAIIMQKMDIVKHYLQSVWKINIDQLRDNVQKRLLDVSSLDINSLSVN